MTELNGRTVSYGYDNLYRLTKETITADPTGINSAVTYMYDAVGNRLQLTSSLAPVPAGLFNYDANEPAYFGVRRLLLPAAAQGTVEMHQTLVLIPSRFCKGKFSRKERALTVQNFKVGGGTSCVSHIR